MNSVIMTPVLFSSEKDDAFIPLLDEVFPGVDYTDLTGRDNVSGLPGTNMILVAAECSAGQISQLKGDDRFFVLKPGPGNKGNALINWLASKGADGHGVTTSDDADTAEKKLREYCKSL